MSSSFAPCSQAALKGQIAQLTASLEASRLTMKDMCDSDAAAARILARPVRAADVYASTFEEEAMKHRSAALSRLFPSQHALDT